LIIVLAAQEHEHAFASDVDLILQLRIQASMKDSERISGTAGILKKELSPFTVDCRLRPEGASSH